MITLILNLALHKICWSTYQHIDVLKLDNASSHIIFNEGVFRIRSHTAYSQRSLFVEQPVATVTWKYSAKQNSTHEYFFHFAYFI